MMTMTKKQYFLFLWILSSMTSIVSMIQYGFNCMGYTGLQCLIFSPLWSIAVHGCAIFFGIYFAQKIGVRFLLLEERYDFVRDTFKPAVFVGVVYAGAALVINALMPIVAINLFSNISPIEFLSMVLSLIRFDLMILLFCVSGIAFIIKKLAKKAPLSVVMPICGGLVGILPHAALLILFMVGSYPLDHDLRSFVVIDSLFDVVTYVLLTRLFWKKGLETAILCHVVIIAILRMIVPTIITFASA